MVSKIKKNFSVKNHFLHFFILGRGICSKIQKNKQIPIKTNISTKIVYLKSFFEFFNFRSQNFMKKD